MRMPELNKVNVGLLQGHLEIILSFLSGMTRTLKQNSHIECNCECA